MQMLTGSGVDFADMLIFLPSRRAVRGVEKMLARRAGRPVILPELVALGEGDDEDTDCDETAGVITNTERAVVLAKLLAADASIGNIATALPVARDLLRMQDYLENEGVDASEIDWAGLIDEKYAAHFQHKASLLNILSSVMPDYAAGRPTETQVRNARIRAWAHRLDEFKLVVVCGSTASVPATADLMAAVAAVPHGRIILSGKIDGCASDFELNTNPYNSEYKFLCRIGVGPSDVRPIDTGTSAMDFFNHVFGNDPSPAPDISAVQHCHLIECARESEEAAAVAEIAARAAAQEKSVLIITPDAAGNQRIAAAIAARGMAADFSGGIPGTMSVAGRAILNLFDDWIERGDEAAFDKKFMDADFNLFEMIARLIAENASQFLPSFIPDDDAAIQIWRAIKKLSDCLSAADVRLTVADARAFLADAIGGVTLRGVMDDDAQIVVLGTIESRMQTADVVILTGLNEGMFPARGYENAWLPQKLAAQIGLPPADRKVSLQSLDFMNLSCGADVYWLRSRTAGGVQTTESRFLSRVVVRRGEFDMSAASDILAAVRARDEVCSRPLDYAAPTPPADWSDVYVTELELLIHNPYAFYVRHILRLRVLDDYWVGPDARAFGDLVHAALENARDLTPDALVADMDARARALLGTDSVMFHFWHKRFVEIAPVASDVLNRIDNAHAEINGVAEIAGRRVRARADRIWDGGVMDIKTGAAPTKTQLMSGNMPQLPLEAYMLRTGGFSISATARAQTPVMTFLQLKNGDVREILYDAQTTAQMIDAAVAKTVELVNMYSAGSAPYEYRETGDRKYQAYDDLARRRD